MPITDSPYNKQHRIRGTNIFCAWVSLTVLFALAIQVLLGANLIALGAELLAIFASILVLKNKGVENFIAVIFFIFVSNTVTISLLVKTILLQDMDSYLVDPIYTFLMFLLNIVVFIAAMNLVGLLKIRPIFTPDLNPNKLGYISWVSFAVGASAWGISTFLTKESVYEGVAEVAAIGGLVIFKEFMVLGVIAATAKAATDAENRKSALRSLVIMLVLSVIAGFADNQKKQIIEPMLGILVTLIYFGKFRKKIAILALIVGLVLSSFVFPVIHAIRYDYHMAQGLQNKVQVVADVFSAGNIWEGIVRSQATAKELSTASYYYDYFRIPGLQTILGRVSTIQMSDPVFYAADARQYLGLDLLVHEVGYSLPGIFFPDKSQVFGGALVTSSLGLSSVEEGAFPTVPLIAESYAAFGLMGLMLSFAIVFLFLLWVKLIGTKLNGNIYTCFCLTIWFPFIAEGSLGQYIGFILRGAPTLILVAFLIQYSYRYKRKSIFL